MMTEACSTPSPDLGEFKVLIVDDEPMLRSVIQDFLVLLGFEDHLVAENGVEALKMIRAEKVDCMLSDIRMPKMELEELLSVVQVEYPNLIVIATSGYSDLEYARNIISKGAHDFLEKPLNLDALELALHWVMKRQQIFRVARRLFGREALPIAPEEAPGRLAEQAAALQSNILTIQSKLKHAIRISELIQRLQLDLDPAARLDLQTAALLHELGTGYQVQYLCRQPRQLDENEVRLIQEIAPITGRMVSRALERQEFEIIIGHHQAWQDRVSQKQDSWPAAEYAAIWLGMLSSLDGFLNDRPDRQAISLESMRERLSRRFKKLSLIPIAMLLDQWNVVEGFYNSSH